METPNHKTAFQERLSIFETIHKITDKECTNLPREQLYPRLLSCIGKTPYKLIQLDNGNRLIQKDETRNPTETHYDRIFIPLIKALEEEGTIKPGDILLETSSGSAGIAFAWACKKLGYKSVLFTPSYLPQPRITEALNLADEVHFGHDKTKYMTECAEMMLQYLRSNRETAKAQGRKIWCLNHSQDYRTPAFFNAIGAELINYLQLTNTPQVDFFIAGIGNGSTIYGIPGWLKKLPSSQFSQMKVIGYEPMQAAGYYKKYIHKWGSHIGSKVNKLLNFKPLPETDTIHSMPGTGTLPGIDFPFNDDSIQQGTIDDIVPVNVEFALSQKNYNANQPQLDQIGVSSQIARYVAEEILSDHTNKTAISLIYDKADRY